MNSKLYNSLIGAFEGRPELIEDRSENSSDLVRNRLFLNYNGQDGGKHIEDALRSSEQGRALIERAHKEFKYYASKLFLFPEDKILIKDSYVESSGSTLPLKVNIEVQNGGSTYLPKSLFIKRQDPVRLAGIELYRILGDVGRDYHFVFNRQNIAEEGIEGVHKKIAEIQPLDEKLVRERIKLNEVVFFLGLDDFAKPANTKITPDHKIVLIDHDTFDRVWKQADIEREKNATCEDLKISRAEYERISGEESRLLNDRVMANRGRLGHLAEVLTGSDCDVTRSVGNYIISNIYNGTRRN